LHPGPATTAALGAAAAVTAIAIATARIADLAAGGRIADGETAEQGAEDASRDDLDGPPPRGAAGDTLGESVEGLLVHDGAPGMACFGSWSWVQPSAVQERPV
jgi:hypothetical protein